MQGLGVEKNYKEASKWYQLSAQQGQQEALFLLGQLYLTGGPGMEKDEKKALKYFLLSAKQKNPDSMCILGELYMNGTPGLERTGRKRKNGSNSAPGMEIKKQFPFCGICI